MPIITDPQTSQQFLQAVKLSLIETKNAHSHHPQLIRFDQKNIQGFTLIKNKTLWIIFRGTDQAEDIIFDLNIFKRRLVKPYPNMNPHSKIKVHSGFLSAYLIVRKKLTSLLTQQIKTQKPKKIIFTGHSLGGALANLASLDFQYNQQTKPKTTQKITTITFGSPRVGNSHFSNSYKKRIPKTHRLVYGQDPIPLFPPLLLGYRHTHPGIYYSHNRWLTHFLPNFTHHNLQNYLLALT